MMDRRFICDLECYCLCFNVAGSMWIIVENMGCLTGHCYHYGHLSFHDNTFVDWV